MGCNAVTWAPVGAALGGEVSICRSKSKQLAQDLLSQMRHSQLPLPDATLRCVVAPARSIELIRFDTGESVVVEPLRAHTDCRARRWAQGLGKQ